MKRWQKKGDFNAVAGLELNNFLLVFRLKERQNTLLPLLLSVSCLFTLAPSTAVRFLRDFSASTTKKFGRWRKFFCC
jgi:hypothetical protein